MHRQPGMYCSILSEQGGMHRLGKIDLARSCLHLKPFALHSHFTSALTCHFWGLSAVSVCADTQSYASWRLEVTKLLKALLNQTSKTPIPQDFSRVGSTQADSILGSLEIMRGK